MPFDFEKLDIAGLLLVKPRVFGDDRGLFLERFKSSDFEAAGIAGPIVQVNESVSDRGVIRGLHYQAPPHAQGKIVGVSAGEVFDVAVDLRRGSPTYGEHVGLSLSSSNRHLIWIPPGFAHGMCALEDGTCITYLVTGAEYQRDAERGIHPFDPDLGIDWPVAGGEATLSPRDSELPRLRDAEIVFEGRPG